MSTFYENQLPEIALALGDVFTAETVTGDGQGVVLKAVSLMMEGSVATEDILAFVRKVTGQGSQGEDPFVMLAKMDDVNVIAREVEKLIEAGDLTTLTCFAVLWRARFEVPGRQSTNAASPWSKESRAAWHELFHRIAVFTASADAKTLADALKPRQGEIIELSANVDDKVSQEVICDLLNAFDLAGTYQNGRWLVRVDPGQSRLWAAFAAHTSGFITVRKRAIKPNESYPSKGYMGFFNGLSRQAVANRYWTRAEVDLTTPFLGCPDFPSKRRDLRNVFCEMFDDGDKPEMIFGPGPKPAELIATASFSDRQTAEQILKDFYPTFEELSC